jgi:arabinose-5-phosphate isomerase
MNIAEIVDEVINTEIEGILQFQKQITADFEKAIQLIYNCKGKLVVTGMGKSGLIGKKIAATLSSTGTPSIFLHPGEAIHGDLGIIAKNDVVLGISYSGETDEILKLIPSFRKMGVPFISMTGDIKSSLAINSDCVINIKVDKEACALKLAPTTSTTVTLVAGDAISVALMKLKEFKELDFAIYHPGGSLGRKLLCKVEDEMQKDNLPTNSETDSVRDVIMKISEGMLGLTVIVDSERKVKGIITDGDLRKALYKNENTFFDLTAQDIMIVNPVTVNKDLLISDAEQLMMQKKINSLLVCNSEVQIVGVINQRTIKYS